MRSGVGGDGWLLRPQFIPTQRAHTRPNRCPLFHQGDLNCVDWLVAVCDDLLSGDIRMATRLSSLAVQRRYKCTCLWWKDHETNGLVRVASKKVW